MQDTAFLSTLSLRRATATAQAVTDTKIISIHALLAESDDIVAAAEIAGHHNFYPRSPCGERRGMKAKEEKSVLISIHALLAESDAPRSRDNPMGRHISIHALLAESDARNISLLDIS